MLAEIINLNIFGFFLVFARVGTILILLPGFAAAWVSIRHRLTIGIAISFVMMPAVASYLPGIPATATELVLVLLGEAVIGFFLGIIGTILLASLQSAGSFIALFSSMANALIRDPIAEQQSSLISGFLSTLGVVLVMVADLHHLMLRAMADSYTLFTPGQLLNVNDAADLLARRVTESFALGLQIATPLAVTALTYYLGLGLLGRLMPALPVFFVGLPIQLAVQFTVLALILSGVMMLFLSRFDAGFRVFVWS